MCSCPAAHTIDSQSILENSIFIQNFYVRKQIYRRRYSHRRLENPTLCYTKIMMWLNYSAISKARYVYVVFILSYIHTHAYINVHFIYVWHAIIKSNTLLHYYINFYITNCQKPFEINITHILPQCCTSYLHLI